MMKNPMMTKETKACAKLASVYFGLSLMLLFPFLFALSDNPYLSGFEIAMRIICVFLFYLHFKMAVILIQLPKFLKAMDCDELFDKAKPNMLILTKLKLKSVYFDLTAWSPKKCLTPEAISQIFNRV